MNYKVLLIFLSACIINTSFSQTFTEEKKIEKSYKVSSSTTVEVINKYGRVHIIPWDIDSVRFEIELSIKSDNLARLQKIKNSIDFEFIDTKYYVMAKTNFNNQYNGILAEIKELSKDLTDIFSNTQYDVKINYLVMVPEYLNIKVDNKYGDIFTDNLNGDISIQLANGNLKANNLNGNSNLNLKFGSATINTVNNGNFSISYGDLEIKEADQLHLDSKASDISIDKVNVLKSNIKGKKVTIQEINNLYGESSYADIWINEVSQDINFTIKYGDLNLESISYEFEFIHLVSKFSDLNLFFEKGSSYSVDFTYKNTNMNYPTNLANIEVQAVPDEDKQYVAYGNIGEGNQDSKLKIEAESGSLNIYHRN